MRNFGIRAIRADYISSCARAEAADWQTKVSHVGRQGAFICEAGAFARQVRRSRQIPKTAKHPLA